MSILNFFSKKTDSQLRLSAYLKSHWGVAPKNMMWYEQALRHKSMVGTGAFVANECNERLELLGDTVLDTVVTQHLFLKLPGASEGELTKIRSRIVNRKSLSAVGKEASLDQHIEAKIGSDDSNEKIVGNAVEAWLGAIYMDRGFEKVKYCIEHHLLKLYLNLDDAISHSSDYKSQFIEWAQAHKIPFNFNTYTHQASGGFVCDLYVKSEVIATSQMRSKKLAEKSAAHLACERLDIINSEDVTV